MRSGRESSAAADRRRIRRRRQLPSRRWQPLAQERIKVQIPAWQPKFCDLSLRSIFQIFLLPLQTRENARPLETSLELSERFHKLLQFSSFRIYSRRPGRARISNHLRELLKIAKKKTAASQPARNHHHHHSLSLTFSLSLSLSLLSSSPFSHLRIATALPLFSSSSSSAIRRLRLVAPLSVGVKEQQEQQQQQRRVGHSRRNRRR